MAARYSLEAGGAIALVATVPKTILNVIMAADVNARIIEFSVSFDGVTASAVPVLVELCRSTQATAGTPAAAPTPVQTGGGPIAAARSTTGRDYSAEPTVLTTLKRWRVHPQGGERTIQFPLGREPEKIESAATRGLCLRCTAPANVNVTGYIEFEEG